MSVMNENPEHFLWVEKYRPSTMDDLLLEDDIKKIIEGFIRDKEIPHLVLSGTAGLGKTCSVKVLCNVLNMDYLFINASLESNIDLLRDKVAHFARTKAALGKTKKIILLDEADGVRSNGFWDALRPMMEQYSSNCRFVMTCNNKEKIPEPILSRSQQIDFFISDKKAYAKKIMERLEFILKEEKIAYDRKILSEMIKVKFPDIRSMIQVMQQFKDSLKDENMKYRYTGKDISKLFTAMKDKNFTLMREIIVNDFDNTEVIYRNVYEGLKDFIDPSTIPNAILVVDDYMRTHYQVVDREIHIVAFCIEFTKNVKFIS
jgi:DNA polymerase III delta prime subunit